MPSQLAPIGDIVIPCQVRLWQNRSVHVFVHPREWSKVSLRYGVPMLVRCRGVEFSCGIASGGEFYRGGTVKGVSPSDLNLPGHGDFEAEARIDWDEAIPELVAAGLAGNPKLAERWRSLPLEEVRRRLDEVLRAREPSVRAERSLKLLADLGC